MKCAGTGAVEFMSKIRGDFGIEEYPLEISENSIKMISYEPFSFKWNS